MSPNQYVDPVRRSLFPLGGIPTVGSLNRASGFKNKDCSAILWDFILIEEDREIGRRSGVVDNLSPPALMRLLWAQRGDGFGIVCGMRIFESLR